MIINFVETMINLLVPDKRTSNTIAFLSPPSNQLQVNNNSLFQNYKVSNNYDEWSGGTMYNRYHTVKYGKQIYYSTINDNIDIFPGNDGWELITNNFIGADDRVYFDGTKLLFEYAINTYFGTVYQPNTTLNSEIYVETLPTTLKGFKVGATEHVSDSVLYTNSTGYIKLTDNEPTQYNLIIWVKDMGLPDKPTEGEIKNFAIKYIVAGVVFKIEGY